MSATPQLMRQNAYNPSNETREEYSQRMSMRQGFMRDASVPAVIKTEIRRDSDISEESIRNFISEWQRHQS